MVVSKLKRNIGWHNWMWKSWAPIFRKMSCSTNSNSNNFKCRLPIIDSWCPLSRNFRNSYTWNRRSRTLCVLYSRIHEPPCWLCSYYGAISWSVAIAAPRHQPAVRISQVVWVLPLRLTTCHVIEAPTFYRLNATHFNNVLLFSHLTHCNYKYKIIIIPTVIGHSNSNNMVAQSNITKIFSKIRLAFRLSVSLQVHPMIIVCRL